MLYFHSFKNPGFVLDIVQDIRSLNELSRESRKAGMIVLGGGVCKHQIANAMLIVSVPFFDCKLLASNPLQRNGADYSVFIVGTTFESFVNCLTLL
jgi:deoxyhypusine synthase